MSDIFSLLADMFKNGNVILAPVVIYLFWQNSTLIKKVVTTIENNTSAMQKTTDVIEKCRGIR
jgi:hypothetical protein